MFLSNNSSTSLNNNYNNNNNNCIDQQPMFDRPLFINDVSPSSKMYPHSLPIHDDHVVHHHHHHHQNLSAAADDQDFIAAFLQQHQDLLVGHQFSQLQQQNTSPTSTTTTTSNVSKQTGINTTTTDHQINFPLNNMNNMEISNNKNAVDGGGSKSKTKSRREPAVTVLWKKKKNTTSKKDRHSKIVTAQGPRDRRMRLSLEIARRFFTLQDMLGFDKASKTVEWLLTKSKGAIKEVTRRSIIKGSSNNTSGGGGGTSSTSECEVVSVFDDHTTNVEDDENSKVQISSNTISNINNPKEKRVRKPTFHPPPLAKDSRANARVRARERTIEKMRSRSTAVPPPPQQPYPQGTIHNMNQLRANYSSSYETGGEESAAGSQSHDMRSTTCLEMVAPEHPPAAARSQSLECQGPNIGGEAEEYSFVITTRNSTSTTTSPFFDYNHEIKTSQGLNLNNNNCNFPENWGDIDSGRAHSSYYSMANNMHLSTTDFQFVSKPWIT